MRRGSMTFTYTVDQTGFRYIPVQVEREILQTFVGQGIEVKRLRADLGCYQSRRVDEANDRLFEGFLFAQLSEGSEVGSEKRLIEEAGLRRWGISAPISKVPECEY